jgi:putative phosphoribosyl transferase
VAEAVEQAKAAAAALDRRLHVRRPPLGLAGKTALLVDDGLATGATMIAAAGWARARRAARVVAAVPVAAVESAALVRRQIEGFVCLHEPADFGAVGLWYETFPQVDDEQVLRLLDDAAVSQTEAEVAVA